MKYLAITAILCLILAGISFAGNVTITEIVTAGNLTLTMPDNFSLSTMAIGGVLYPEGSAQATYAVEDSRGTGLGWNLGFQISDFTTSGTPVRTIPSSTANRFALRIYQANITSAYGQAVDGTNGPLSLITNGSWVKSTQVKGVQVLADYGMGKYNILTNHTLSVNADIYAGTYTATLTATLNAVP